MKAKSTVPKMSQSPDFIPLNPFAGIHLLIRSLSVHLEAVFYPQNITGLSPGKFSPIPLSPLHSIKLLAELSADENSIQTQPDRRLEMSKLSAALNFQGRLSPELQPILGLSQWGNSALLKRLQQGTNREWIARVPIILNFQITRIQVVPPILKIFTVKTGDFTRNSRPNQSQKEAIHPNEYSSRTAQEPTGLSPRVAQSPGISPDDLVGQILVKDQPQHRSFIAVNPCFFGKKDRIFSRIDPVGLRPAFT